MPGCGGKSRTRQTKKKKKEKTLLRGVFFQCVCPKSSSWNGKSRQWVKKLERSRREKKQGCR